MNALNHLRATGRTTRMLEDAVKLACSLRSVYVVADNAIESRRIIVELSTVLRRSNAPEWVVKETNDAYIFLLRGAGSIRVTVPDQYFNWTELRWPGMSQDAVTLVDHHCIEDRFAPILEMLHRYDQPSTIN